MSKRFKILLTGVLVSMFYFPFEFTFLPGVNTKMIMAVVGLIIIVIGSAIRREFVLPNSFLFLLVLSSLVSLISFFSVTYNNTPDYTYVSYVVSAAVWLSAAFLACFVIKRVHGYIDVQLMLNYLIAVCVCQCIIALVIDFMPVVRSFVDHWVVGGSFYGEINRLYGIGAALDIAGTRFSCVLVCIGFFLGKKSGTMSMRSIFLLFLAFIIISVIGNMIARTTLVGVVLGLLLLCLGLVDIYGRINKGQFKLLGTIALALLVVIPVIVFFYRTNAQFYKLFRFGFEGFVSWVETGEWHVSSNDVLENMVVWPDNLKTWVIGDGYFMNQRYDPNYIGDAPELGYYMGTDIGYLRFLFYFGIIGLLSIVSVITYAANECMKQYKEYSLMFLVVLVAGLIMWWKAATDIFLFFALFLCQILLVQEDNKQPGVNRRHLQ